MSPRAETSAQLRQAVLRLRARPVVSLRRFSSLRSRLAHAEAEDLLAELNAELRRLAEELYHLYGDQLIDWIAECSVKCGVPKRHSAAWLADWVTARSYFWRTSQKARRWYAQFADVAVAEIAAHVRGGRPVRQHHRLLGFEHLIHLANVGGVAGEVLLLVASGAHRRKQQGSPARQAEVLATDPG